MTSLPSTFVVTEIQTKVALRQSLLVRAALLLIAIGAGLLALVPSVRAQDLQPIPALSARVIDKTATLDAAQVQALEAKLAAFEQSRGSQIVVLMVPSTLPEDITD